MIPYRRGQVGTYRRLSRLDYVGGAGVTAVAARALYKAVMSQLVNQKVVLKPVKNRKYKRGSLKGDLKKIKMRMNKDMSFHTHRRRDVLEVGPAVEGLVSNDAFTGNDQTSTELALQNLRFFNPAAPGTLVTGALAGAGTYHNDVHIKNFYTKCWIRNNYQIPAIVRLYLVTPKQDGDISSTAAYTNGALDQGAVSTNSPLIHFTDMDQWNDLWKIQKYKKVFLDAGKEFSLGYSGGDYWYDSSLNDSTGLNFRRQWKACQWLIRVEGTIGHDIGGTAFEVNTTGASVDVIVDRTWKIEYDAAGVSLNDYTVDNNATTSFTTAGAGIVCNKAVADLQVISAT